MKTVFEGEILHVIPMDKGIIITYCEKRTDTQLSVAFKMISFETGKVTNVAKNIYQLSKFGASYRLMAEQTNNYLTCKVISLPSEKMLIIELDGTLKLLESDSTVLWSGQLLYKNAPPTSLALFENKLWTCYAEHNVVVRYNINTMREELRIGGGTSSVFKQPSDIFIKHNIGYVCNPGTLQVLTLNLNTYDLEVYKEFTAPVKQYLEVDGYSFVVMENGVYLLD